MDIREAVHRAIDARGQDIAELYNQILDEAVEFAKLDDCPEHMHHSECRMVGDLVVYHIALELFEAFFERQLPWEEEVVLPWEVPLEEGDNDNKESD